MTLTWAWADKDRCRTFRATSISENCRKIAKTSSGEVLRLKWNYFHTVCLIYARFLYLGFWPAQRASRGQVPAATIAAKRGHGEGRNINAPE